jgi:hypothetical protein
MLVRVHGQPCRIVKIRDFGTLDVESVDSHRAFRVSGVTSLEPVPQLDIKLIDVL